jgi:TetR/AcrR family transcriptional regulator, cholesterol catabolism regulator
LATVKRGTLGHRRGQVPLEARREELLSTAARLFATQGYDATRLDDIADALGVTRAALYYYFPGGKSEILEVVCEAATSAAEAVIADALAAPTTIEQLRGYAIRLPEVNTTDEARVFYREVSQLEPAFRAGLSRRVQKLNAAIEGLVEAGIAEGTLRDDIDPRIATQALVGMVQWIPQWFRASKKNASAKEVGEMFADIFLDGMRP